MNVDSRLKADPIECVCGCGLVGFVRVKAWRDGLGAHVKRCPCRRCVGGRQRSKAGSRERKVAKLAGGERSPLSGGLNGYDGRSGLWVWEETAQESLVRGLRRWWLSRQVQAKTARLMALRGVRRAVVLSWDGTPQLVVMPFEDWANEAKEAAS